MYSLEQMIRQYNLFAKFDGSKRRTYGIPLFYPHGSQVWHTNIAKISNRTFVVDNDDPQDEQSNRRVTRGSYVKYRIGIRSDHSMHFCYLVDYFNNRLLIVTLKSRGIVLNILGAIKTNCVWNHTRD